MSQLSNSTALRIAFRSVRAERWTLASAVVLALCSAAPCVITPLVVSRLITNIAERRSVLTAVLELAGSVIAGALAGGLSTYLLTAVSERAVATVRFRLLDHIVRLPVGSVRRFGSGELISRLGSDTAQLRVVTDTAVAGLPVCLLTVTALAIAMGLIDWVLLLVVTGTFAFAALGIRMFLAGMRRGSTLQQEALGKMTQEAKAVLDCITTVKAFHAEDRVLRPLGAHMNATATAAIRTARSQSLVSPIMGLGQQCALIAVLSVGGIRLADGDLSGPHFIAFLMYLFQLVSPLMSLAQASGRIQIGVGSANRLDSIFAEASEPTGPPTIDPAAVPQSPTAAQVSVFPSAISHPALELRDVRLSYGSSEVLAGVSFRVPATGLVGVVGVSGAGKSSLLGVVEAFYPTSGGRILLHGRDLQEWPVAAARARLALVEQDSPVLIASVRDNLCLGREEAPRDAELWSRLHDVDLAEVVHALPGGLDCILGHSVQLSSGERQRLAIARALLTDAAVLLLDEPSSALDGANEARLMELLAVAARSRAVVMIAHRLNTIRAADSILVMSGGKVAGSGTHDELLSECATYRAMVHHGEPDNTSVTDSARSGSRATTDGVGSPSMATLSLAAAFATAGATE
jgi:ABC-type multidrug transport system fused ATPase/permease subunit